MTKARFKVMASLLVAFLIGGYILVFYFFGGKAASIAAMRGVPTPSDRLQSFLFRPLVAIDRKLEARRDFHPWAGEWTFEKIDVRGIVRGSLHIESTGAYRGNVWFGEIGKDLQAEGMLEDLYGHKGICALAKERDREFFISVGAIDDASDEELELAVWRPIGKGLGHWYLHIPMNR